MPATLFSHAPSLNPLEAELLVQVQEHQSLLHKRIREEVTLEQAFESWGQTVFGPLSSAIEEEGLDREFPEIGDDELFLRVNRHWHQLARGGCSVSPREAVFDFGAQFAPREDSRTDFRLKKLFLCFQEGDQPSARISLKATLLSASRELDLWDVEILRLVEDYGRRTAAPDSPNVPREKAFDAWYEAVYIPLCSAIDEEYLDLEFTGLSQSEVFVLVCRHGETLRKGSGEIDAREVVKNYKALFADYLLTSTATPP